MSIAKLIKPGDAVSAGDVYQNFSAFSADLASVTSDDIEPNSIRTRHITTSRGEWKEVTVHTNAGPWANPAGDTLACPASAATETTTKAGQMVMVVATAQFASTAASGTGTCTADLRLMINTVEVRAMTVRVLGPEKLQIGTTYAFEATLDQHLIQLYIKGGGTTFSVSNAEIQVIAVRG